MSKVTECEQCGGNDFYLESGFYFCSECQVQSQDIREQVFDDFTFGVKSSKSQLPSSQDPAQASQEPNECGSVTSFEVLNYIVAGLVDELLSIGASPSLKVVTLQLWATYLRKLEVAFTSTKIARRPRLGAWFRKCDAGAIYGVNKKLADVYRKPLSQSTKKRKVDPSSKASSSFISERSKKIRLSKKKKSLAQAEYWETASEYSQSSAVTLESLSSRSSTSTQKSARVRYAKYAAEQLQYLEEKLQQVGEDKKEEVEKLYIANMRGKLTHCRLAEVFSIISLGLILTHNDIYSADILRWCDEGYLSLYNGVRLVPEGVQIPSDLTLLLRATAVRSARLFQSKLVSVGQFLGAHGLRTNIKDTISRYIKELQLPEEIGCVVCRLLAINPPLMRMTAVTNHEARAMGFILFSLKLLFGLNGYTEFQLSAFAERQNRKKGLNLFVWTEWCKMFTWRSAVVSRKSHFLRFLHFPKSRLGGLEPLIAQWDERPFKTSAKPTFSKKDKELNYVLMKLMSLCGKEAPRGERPTPTTTPHHSLLSKMVREGLQVPHHLTKDFTTTSIHYTFLQKREESGSMPEGWVKVENKLDAHFPPVSMVTVKVKKSCKGVVSEGEGGRTVGQEEESDYPSGNLLQRVSVSEEGGGWVWKKKHPPPAPPFWLFHKTFFDDRATRMRQGAFTRIAKESLPPTFYWLLNEAAKIISQTTRDLYYELVYIEKMWVLYLNSSGTFDIKSAFSNKHLLLKKW